MIETKLKISGITINDAYDFSVNKSTSNSNSSSNFIANVNNFNGVNSDTFIVGNDVEIYADTNIIREAGSPTVWFKFNTSGTNITDDMGLVTGSVKGNITFIPGKISNAIYIPGSNTTAPNIVAPSIGSLFPASGDHSVMFWEYSLAGSGHIYNNMAGNAGLYPRCYFDSNGSIIFQARVNGVTKTFGNTARSPYNTWTHWANVYDSSVGSVYTYKNGNLITTSNVGLGSLTTDTTGSFLIGMGQFGHYNGYIDDFRFYNRVVDNNTVLEVFNKSSGTELITNSNQLIFNGILEDIQYKGENMRERIMLQGRDYSARLMDRTVEPEVYTNMEIGSIVKDILNKYVDDIGSSDIPNTGIILNRIAFRHKPVYDAIKDLAKQAEYVFYVDTNNQLQFKEASTTSSGYTFDSGNVITADFREQRDTVYNQVWVYGDRYLDGYKETFTAGSPLGGSIFTLLYNPHSTEVTVSGAIIQPGGIQNISVVPASGTRYLVNYEDKKIIFTSGTSLGANIPSSGNSVIVTYKRALPIIKVGDDYNSQSQYGKRVKVIQDKDIKDPNTAEDIMKQTLSDLSTPIKEGTLEIRGIVDVVPSQTAVINLPYHNVNNATYEIIEANYNFNKINNINDEVLTVKVNKKINDVTDVLKQVILDIKKIQAGDISDSDILTRYQASIGSIGIRHSGIEVFTRSLGSSFILGVGYHGVTGPTYGGVLGSIIASGINFLGDSRGPFTLVFSGGYF